MGAILFVTHPEVIVDPSVAVPCWPLSARGRGRMESLAERIADAGVQSVWSSAEQKALDGAQILATRLKLRHQVDEALGENDRSSTGYIAPPEFWAVVSQFFAEPAASVRGWETAEHAQARIVAAVRRVAAATPEGLAIVVSHGGVGRLLAAALQDVPIGQEEKPENPGGGGYLVLRSHPLSLRSGKWGDIDTLGIDELFS